MFPKSMKVIRRIIVKKEEDGMTLFKPNPNSALETKRDESKTHRCDQKARGFKFDTLIL